MGSGAKGGRATRCALLLTATAAILIPSAKAELVQEGPVRVAVSGSLFPKRLPRHGAAPITVKIGGQISSTQKSGPPQLKEVSFAFNEGGRLDTKGLAKCRLGRINPSTTQEALENCRSSLVGEGHFSANVLFPEQSPFPSEGKVLAFNGVLRGKPAIFAHIYGTEPVPTSYVLPLTIHRQKGPFSTRLDGSLPAATGNWGYVTGLELKMGRTYTARGKTHSFLSAGCPAQAGYPGAIFPLVRTRFAFAGGKVLSETLNRTCKAKG